MDLNLSKMKRIAKYLGQVVQDNITMIAITAIVILVILL